MTQDEMLLQLLCTKVQALKEDVGPTYASVMEGYGNLMALMTTVEEIYKELRKAIKSFIPSSSQLMMEDMRDKLTSMEHEAMVLGNASVAMASRVRLYRDTVVAMAGGDLIDEINKKDE